MCRNVFLVFLKHESDLRSDEQYLSGSQIPHRPEFFSGLIFTTTQVAVKLYA